MSSQLSAQLAEPPWGAESRFELWPALQQVSALSALPFEPRCTLSIRHFYLLNPRISETNIVFSHGTRQVGQHYAVNTECMPFSPVT
jgi:hypothetical protein